MAHRSTGEMFVLVVDEIISTNGVFTGIPIEETGQGYLTPAEWREALAAAGDDTVVIDVRNKNEARRRWRRPSRPAWGAWPQSAAGGFDQPGQVLSA